MTVKLQVTQQWWDNGDESPTGWDCAVRRTTPSLTSIKPRRRLWTSHSHINGVVMEMVVSFKYHELHFNNTLTCSENNLSITKRLISITWISYGGVAELQTLHRGPSDVAHLPSQTFTPQSNLHHERLHPPWTWTLSAPPSGWSMCSSGAGGPVE